MVHVSSVPLPPADRGEILRYAGCRKPGPGELELLESTSPDGPIARFIEKNGEGIQHIAIRVDDIDAALAELKEKGVRLIDQTPRYGAGGARIAFLHPKATHGVLLELCERK